MTHREWLRTLNEAPQNALVVVGSYREANAYLDQMHPSKERPRPRSIHLPNGSVLHVYYEAQGIEPLPGALHTAWLAAPVSENFREEIWLRLFHRGGDILGP